MGRARDRAGKAKRWGTGNARLGTGQAGIWVHTLEILSLECVGANGPTIVHTGMGSKGPGLVKGGDGTTYVMTY